jgi:hypothetical protein
MAKRKSTAGSIGPKTVKVVLKDTSKELKAQKAQQARLKRLKAKQAQQQKLTSSISKLRSRACSK